MIKRTLFRLLCAIGIGLLGVFRGTSGSIDGLTAALLFVGTVWGFFELFLLLAILFFYGITGLAHDIGAAQDRDPWGRW